MQSLPSRTDVAIAGAGPTGLTLGCLLAAENVSFVLLDQQAAGANTSRAAVVHARTLEVLDRIGVTGRLLDAGLVVPTFTVRDRDRTIATIPFGQLPTPHPHTLMIPQSSTEAILLQRLGELGGAVHRPCRVTALEQDTAGCALTIESARHGTHRLEARYVVGADGMHSTLRQGAGIAFHGAQYSESFVLADVHMSWPLSRDQVALFFSPAGLVVVAPLPDNCHRIVATCNEAPETPDVDFMQALLDERGPEKTPGRIHDIVWSSRFHLHHRLAERYRAGGLFLAGDAAHVHSPAGGQGMNTGIQDAVGLADVLVDVLKRGADPARLDDYERLRRPVAERVVTFTDRMTRLATLRTAPQRRVRNAVLSQAARLPRIRRRIAMTLSGLRNQ